MSLVSYVGFDYKHNTQLLMDPTFSYFLADPSSIRNFTIVGTTHISISLSWTEPLKPNGLISQYEINYVVDGTKTADNCTGTNSTPSNLTSAYVQEIINSPRTKEKLTGLTPHTCYRFQIQAIVVFRNETFLGDIDVELLSFTNATSKLCRL